MKVCKTLKTYFHTPKSLINQGKQPIVRMYESFFKSIIEKNYMCIIYVYMYIIYICILRHPTADFAEQNGRNAKLIGHRPLPL